MPELKWKNLVDMKCPKCGALIEFKHNFKNYECMNEFCRMRIKREKFEAIVESLYHPTKRPTAMSNFEGLQSL